ncbi:MAG TPA: lysophospholipase [Nocardioidaceae bacterium]|nr:lysophospholipase [Nocardioidaceae bacterium]
MEHRDGTFTGASGGESYWQAWLPERPKAVIVFAHGVSEHTGRYEYVGERLVAGGYALYAIDHHGHGKSAGTPGNVDRFSYVIEDLHTLRLMAVDAHPGVAVFVMGHSMGGLVALDYLTTKSQAGVAGLVLTGAAVDPTVGSKLERMLAPLISRLAPNLALVDIGSNDISRDPDIVTTYQNDPLVYNGKIRARTGAEALAAVGRVTTRMGSLTLPALVMHGTDDKIVSPSGSNLVYESIRSKDKTLKLYDGLYHEILNEPEKDTVIDEILAWLDKHA